LPKITEAINKSLCRVTGLRPIDVNENNAGEIWEELFGHHVRAKDIKAKFTKGDKVRVALEKPAVFSKGYHPNFTDHIYEIVEVSKTNPNLYKLKTNEGEIIEKRFYPQELQKVQQEENTTYRIEEIIDERKKGKNKEYLIKFIGYPNPEWILESNIIQ